MSHSRIKAWFGKAAPATAARRCGGAAEGAARDSAAETASAPCREDGPGPQPVILVPTDFSPEAAQALETAVILARQLGGRLMLFHAVHLNLTPCGPANPSWLNAALCQEAMQKAEPLLSRAQAAGVPATCVVETGAGPDAILRAAQKWQAGVILLTRRRRRWFERWFGGRTFERVVRGALCPVLALQFDREKSPRRGWTFTRR